MKKFWKPSLFIFLGISQIAALCDEELAVTSADSWYESVARVEEDESTTEAEYTHDDVIDLASDPEIAKHKDKFKDVTISEIWLETSNVTGTGVRASGTLSFTSSSGTVVLADYQGLMIANGGKLEIIPDQAALELIEDTLLANAQATIKYTVVLDGAPVAFDLKARYHVVLKVGL